MGPDGTVLRCSGAAGTFRNQTFRLGQSLLWFFCSLEATEEKFRNRESRHEDLQVIAELKDMVSERESLVKKLVVGDCWRGSLLLSHVPPLFELLPRRGPGVQPTQRSARLMLFSD